MSQRVLNLSHAPRRAAAAAAVLAITPGLAAAGGFYAQELSVKGAGRAYSGEAADIGADSQWWNPAAIARSGNELTIGAHGRFNSDTLRDEGSTVVYPGGATVPVGGESVIEDSTQDDVVPNGAFSVGVGDRLAAGVSVTQPFLLDTHLSPTFWGRYDTITAHVKTTDIQGTVAAQVNSWLDVGVGVSAQYTEAMLENAMPNLSPLLPDARSSLSGEGWNYGWTVGAQAHTERLTVGASYRSAMNHELDTTVRISGLLPPLDAFNFTTDQGEADFKTPWMAVVSARFRVTPQLTLNGQVQRFGWSEYDAIRIRFPGGGDRIAQNYKDTTAWSVGADYAVNRNWTLRGGVQLDETPTPDDLREPGVPDTDRRLYTAGASVRVAPNVTLDGAVGLTDFKGARIDEDSVFYAGSPAATTTRVRGSIKREGRTASLGLRWRF